MSTPDPPLAVNRGVSEFGEELARLVETVRGARGAVLTDDEGDPIDMAYRPDRISELDIQIAGAQLGLALSRTATTAIIHGLGGASVIVESERGTLIAAPLERVYLAAVVLDPKAQLARAAAQFEQTCAALTPMLR